MGWTGVSRPEPDTAAICAIAISTKRRPFPFRHAHSISQALNARNQGPFELIYRSLHVPHIADAQAMGHEKAWKGSCCPRMGQRRRLEGLLWPEKEGGRGSPRMGARKALGIFRVTAGPVGLERQAMNRLDCLSQGCSVRTCTCGLPPRMPNDNLRAPIGGDVGPSAGYGVWQLGCADAAPEGLCLANIVLDDAHEHPGRKGKVISFERRRPLTTRKSFRGAALACMAYAGSPSGRILGSAPDCRFQ